MAKLHYQIYSEQIIKSKVMKPEMQTLIDLMFVIQI